MKQRSLILTALVMAWLAPRASGHFLWIETDEVGTKAVVRAGFGEVGSWEAEYAPRIAKAEYFVISKDAKRRPIRLNWNEKSEAYEGDVESKETVIAVAGTFAWGLFGRGGVTESLVYYYPKSMIGSPSKWSGAKPVAGMKVEIAPNLDGSTARLTVLVEGKPTKGQKIKFHGPAGDKREMDTDANGQATFSIAKEGLYFATAVHRTKEKGDFEGQPYDGVMHCATLTFRMATHAAGGH